jgi:hypothetical protein
LIVEIPKIYGENILEGGGDFTYMDIGFLILISREIAKNSSIFLSINRTVEIN